MTPTQKLIEAAEAVCDRWDSPLWKDAKPTADYIATLREAVRGLREAGTYTDSTPHLSVGDSAFEPWFAGYNPAGKSDKQRARDAYAAGMGDPLVVAREAGLCA